MKRYDRQTKDRVVKLARSWARTIGEGEAESRLYFNRKFGFSTASKIARGRYESTPSDMFVTALIEEMALDGFTLSDEKAS
jgi:hypothetical protein